MSVETVRAGISLSKEKAKASIAALQQASMALEEAQQILSQTTTGSSQPEVSQAQGMYAEALQSISSTQSVVYAAVASADSYAARL